MSLAILVSDTAIVRSAPGRLHQPVAGSLSFERISRRTQFRQTGLRDQHRDHSDAEVVGSVEAGTHRGAADRQLAQPGQTRAHPLDAGLDLAGISAELLAECHRNGVHQMRSARLHHRVPIKSLGGQCVVQLLQRWDEMSDRGLGGRDVGGRREGVVGRLRHVHVVVGMQRDPALGRDGRNHLVGVHVGAGARAGLEDVDGKLVVVLTVGDLGGRGDDGVGFLRRQQPEVGVHLRAGAFQQA